MKTVWTVFDALTHKYNNTHFSTNNFSHINRMYYLLCRENLKKSYKVYFNDYIKDYNITWIIYWSNRIFNLKNITYHIKCQNDWQNFYEETMESYYFGKGSQIHKRLRNVQLVYNRLDLQMEKNWSPTFVFICTGFG